MGYRTLMPLRRMHSMKHLLYTTISSFLLILTTQLYGQDQFERLYTTTNTDILSTSLHELGNGYLMLSLQINDKGENEKINLTSLDQKGTINWSMEYDYDLEEDVFIAELGEVEALIDGTIAFSALLKKDSLNKVVTVVDGQGNHLWTRLTGNIDDIFDDNSFRSNLVSVDDLGFIHVTNSISNNQSDLFLSAYYLAGELRIGSRWAISDTSGNSLSTAVRDVQYLSDSTVVILGNTMDKNHQLFVTKIDSTGNILWAKSYTADLGTGLNQSATSLDEMIDGTIIILGARAGSVSNGLLLHIDQQGNYLQSRSITPTGSGYDGIAVEVEALQDTTFAVAMKRLNLTTNEVLPVIIKMNMDSIISYQTVLKSSTDRDPMRGGLIVSNDSLSPVFLTSTTRLDSMTLIPYIMKLNPTGGSGCEDAFNSFRFDSIFFTTDTLSILPSIESEFDSIEVRSMAFTEFNPPILNLTDTTYCPQDPIRYTLDGTVRGAVSYLWSDGVTDSIRTVTEAGQYVLNVIVGIEECFTLCDTANVNQSEFPMAEIEVNTANFCSTGELALNVASNNPIVSIEWSSGQIDEPFIIVTDLNQYSATIIDNCGNPAIATIDLRDFSINNDPVINVSGENLCTDNTLVLTAAGNFLIEDLMWSTGEVGTATITVSEPGTYTVENIAQFCPGIGSVEIIEDQFLTPLTVDISSTCDAGNNVIQLIGGGSTSISSITWSTGATSPSIQVTEVGTYTVTVTDICDNTETASITITQEDIDDCITVGPTVLGTDCLLWPNALYPMSNNPRNTTFGPEDMNCGNVTIENYQLRIYNRWGNKIFESDNIKTRWNGLKNNTGKEQPATTYFWYATYTINGDDFENEGDATVIR